MSRGRKRTNQEKRRRQRENDREHKRFGDVVADTAARFTCSVETAQDFAYQCDERCEGLDCDLAFNRVAHEIWAGREGPTQPLAEALAELLAERQRHFEALTALGERFAALARVEEHHHLDPPEAYRDLIRQRVFDEPPVSG